MKCEIEKKDDWGAGERDQNRNRNILDVHTQVVCVCLKCDVGIVHDMTHDMNYTLYKNGYHFFIVCIARIWWREVKRINIKKASFLYVFFFVFLFVRRHV